MSESRATGPEAQEAGTADEQVGRMVGNHQRLLDILPSSLEVEGTIKRIEAQVVHSPFPLGLLYPTTRGREP